MLEAAKHSTLPLSAPSHGADLLVSRRAELLD
jgi:hypothetical protein